MYLEHLKEKPKCNHMETPIHVAASAMGLIGNE